jgi:purine-binding chemotaxis protein CheW
MSEMQDTVLGAARADTRPFRDRLAEDEQVQAVAFRIGGELHACDILLVEEVVTKRRIHRLPDMPPRLLGMLRLRGELVPVLDVSDALDLALEGDAPSVLVVALDDGRVGVAADQVHEVVSLPNGSLRPAPLTGGDRDQFVLGVARADGRLLNLIDLAEILRVHTTLAPGERR